MTPRGATPIPLGRDSSRCTLPGPQPTLVSGPVRLRPFLREDIDAVLAACVDAETQRWTTVPTPYGREHAEYFVRQHAPSQWQTGAGAVWVICAEDGAYAGSMDLRIYPTDTGHANVGFLCAPWARGQGLTTTALRMACRWGFDALGLARIEWRAFVGNDASRRVAEKAGFVPEGTARSALVQRGERRDAWVASMLPTDQL